MQRLLIVPAAACLLSLTACTPGTYVPSRGTFYPTPKNETVQPWQRPTVKPLPPAPAKQAAPAKPPKHNPGHVMM